MDSAFFFKVTEFPPLLNQRFHFRNQKNQMEFDKFLNFATEPKN